MKPTIIGGIAAATGLLVDQTTKAWVIANAEFLRFGHEIFPGFNLVLGRNDGIAFGLFQGMPWWTLSAVAIGICGLLAVWVAKTSSRIEAIAYGLIIGGAVGNVIDRIRYQAVTDFLDFYIGSAHWPAFNLADTFVVSGVALLLVSSYSKKPL